MALTIMALLSASVVPTFVGQSRLNTLSEKKTEAVQAAQLVLDDLRVEDISLLPVSGNASPRDVTAGTRTYQVVVSYCGNPDHCPPNTSDNTRHLAVAVSLNGEVMYEIATVFTNIK